MSIHRLALIVVVLSVVGSGIPAAFGQSAPPPRQGRSEPGKPPADPGATQAAPQPRRPPLDELFARLAGAKDDEEAKGIAGLIERRFERSGSDTADLLMQRSGEAIRGEDAALAVELLDRVTQLKPDWAEAWNRRAAAFYQLDDPARAIMDLQESLAREPRHFGAWIALGHVEMAAGDKQKALLAYRKALALYPLQPELKKTIERLAPDVDGRDL